MWVMFFIVGAHPCGRLFDAVASQHRTQGGLLHKTHIHEQQAQATRSTP